MISDYVFIVCRKCGSRSFHEKGARVCRDCQLKSMTETSDGPLQFVVLLNDERGWRGLPPLREPKP